MKLFIVILQILALGFIFFNLFQLNFDALFKGQSLIAVITIVAGACAILLLQVLKVSKQINTIIKKGK